MSAITYPNTTIGVADQSALLSRIAAWCTHFVEGVREGQEIAARYNALARATTHWRDFRPRNSPGTALTVK